MDRALHDPNHLATVSLFFCLLALPTAACYARYIWTPGALDRDRAFMNRVWHNWYILPLMEVLLILACIFMLQPAVVRRIRAKETSTSFYLVVSLVYFLTLAVPLLLILSQRSHPVLRSAVLLEQTRYLMKIVSFISENQDIENGEPSKTSLLYFLFAPVLVYRHTYPRLPGSIRWSRVFSLPLHFLLSPLLLLTIHRMLDIGSLLETRPLESDEWLQLITWSFLMSGLCVYGMGFFYLHCWCNAFAEILRFGDREFYQNWWTSQTMFDFYNTWNKIVRIWMAEYMNRPLIQATGSRGLAMIITFTVSALVHDYIVSVSIGYLTVHFTSSWILVLLLYPLLIKRRNGLPVRSEPRPTTNIVFWVSMFQGVFLTLYIVMEETARSVCHRDAGISGILKSRAWNCLHLSARTR